MNKPMIMRKVTVAPRFDAFCRSLPFKLIPTNVPGVFTSPAPPEDFDPRTATATSLVQHGLLWPRPGKVDDPRVVAFWEKVFSRRWLSKDRIMPRLRPQPGKTHRLRGVRKTADNNFASNNRSAVVRSRANGSPAAWVERNLCADPTLLDPCIFLSLRRVG